MAWFFHLGHISHIDVRYPIDDTAGPCQVRAESRRQNKPDMLEHLKTAISHASRKRRAELFCRTLRPHDADAILDLGGGRGGHFATYFPHLKNVQIADYNPCALEHAARVHGFRTRVVDGTEVLPFAASEFDIVFCSSVIEHVSGPKAEAIKLFKGDGRVFRETAWRHQCQFAAEIRRTGKRYFVQTPNRYFPVETHSWIPFLGFLPSHLQWRVIRRFNWFWPRKNEHPDWALLSHRDMKQLFPQATIVRERFLVIFTKSLIAIQN